MTNQPPDFAKFPEIGQLLSLHQAADLVYETTVLARKNGCIPIAAAVLRQQPSGELFQLEGFGHNQLGWGRPFVHGETGAFQSAGTIDYRETLLLSSLSPCEFCQGCATHLGVQEVKYLDAVNFVPDQKSFADYRIQHAELRHSDCCSHFADWLESDAGDTGRNLWHQDIGSYTADPAVEVDMDRLEPALFQVLELMNYAAALNEYPCAAVVLDSSTYEILSYGPGSILRTNDPTAVPEIFAGRQCSARTRWDRTIFLSSHPPSPITAGMYRRWGVKNVVSLIEAPITVETDSASISPEFLIQQAPLKFTDQAESLVKHWISKTSPEQTTRLQSLYGGLSRQ